MKQKQYLAQFVKKSEATSEKVAISALMYPVTDKFPFLKRTVLLKSPNFDLAELGISYAQLSLLKGFGILIGMVIFLLFFRITSLSSSLVWTITFSILGGALGWIIPEVYLLDRLSSRRFFIQQAVPDFLDQFHLLVSSAAYESFGQSLQHIAPAFPGPLGEKLRSLQKIQPFVSERELLLQLEKACQHPLITELITVIQVSHSFGSSLSEKTNQLIQTAQIEREHRIKDLGNKTSGILLGPLLIFHLPALLIIFLIPFVFILQKGF